MLFEERPANTSHLTKHIPALVKAYTKEEETCERMVPLLIKKGIDNINLEMFSEDMQRSILNALAEELVKKGRMQDAIKTFSRTSNLQRLVEIGDSYSAVSLFGNAIDCYEQAKNKPK